MTEFKWKEFYVSGSLTLTKHQISYLKKERKAYELKLLRFMKRQIFRKLRKAK